MYGQLTTPELFGRRYAPDGHHRRHQIHRRAVQDPSGKSAGQRGHGPLLRRLQYLPVAADSVHRWAAPGHEPHGIRGGGSGVRKPEAQDSAGLTGSVSGHGRSVRSGYVPASNPIEPPAPRYAGRHGSAGAVSRRFLRVLDGGDPGLHPGAGQHEAHRRQRDHRIPQQGRRRLRLGLVVAAPGPAPAYCRCRRHWRSHRGHGPGPPGPATVSGRAKGSSPLPGCAGTRADHPAPPAAHRHPHHRRCLRHESHHCAGHLPGAGHSATEPGLFSG